MASHRNKRSSCEKQRESLQNQERIESHRYGDAICQIHVLKKKKRKKKKVDGEESTVALQTTRSAPIQKYRAKLEDQWEEQFNQLMEFKSKEGHCNVPFNHADLSFILHSTHYDIKATLYTEEQSSRIKRLQGIGFVWDVDDFCWEEKFELEKYKKDNGHCRMPARHQCETGTFLGPWVMQQRYLYKKYKNNEPAYGMTPMRINHLENIGFEWSIPLK
ncbi:hypothetical protein ACHAXH_006898 [Discostella pseudostelligera]